MSQTGLWWRISKVTRYSHPNHKIWSELNIVPVFDISTIMDLSTYCYAWRLREHIHTQKVFKKWNEFIARKKNYPGFPFNAFRSSLTKFVIHENLQTSFIAHRNPSTNTVLGKWPLDATIWLIRYNILKFELFVSSNFCWQTFLRRQVKCMNENRA